MIMIAILHEVLMMVILPMLPPLIKIGFQDIPILAEHLSVIHFSQKFYGMPLLQLCFKYFNFASNIQNAPKAPISAITSSMPKVATR